MLDSDFKDGGIFGNSFWNEKPGDPGASAGVINAAPNPDQDFIDWLQSKFPEGTPLVYQGNQYQGTGDVKSTSSVIESEPVTLENAANEGSGTLDKSETKEGSTLSKNETGTESSEKETDTSDDYEWVTHLNGNDDSDTKKKNSQYPNGMSQEEFNSMYEYALGMTGRGGNQVLDDYGNPIGSWGGFDTIPHTIEKTQGTIKKLESYPESREISERIATSQANLEQAQQQLDTLNAFIDNYADLYNAPSETKDASNADVKVTTDNLQSVQSIPYIEMVKKPELAPGESAKYGDVELVHNKDDSWAATINSDTTYNLEGNSTNKVESILGTRMNRDGSYGGLYGEVIKDYETAHNPESMSKEDILDKYAKGKINAVQAAVAISKINDSMLDLRYNGITADIDYNNFKAGEKIAGTTSNGKVGVDSFMSDVSPASGSNATSETNISKDIALEFKNLNEINSKVDSIDVNGDASDAQKELSEQMTNLAVVGKSTFESMVRDFLSEGGKLQDIRENENLKQFSSEIFSIAQKIYDKTSAIEERTNSYGLGNLDEKSIKQNLGTITDKINELTERMPTYYSPGSDMGGIGSSGVTLDKNQIKALAEYTESVQCTKDAAIALMKSAAFNGAANVTGDKYSEAWKKEMAVRTVDNRKTMTKEQFFDKDTLKWTDYLAAGAKGTLGTMIALLGGAVTTINPALGIILMGAGSSAVGKAGLDISTKVSRSKSTNEEVMFGTNESGAVNVMNDIYNRSLEPANYGDIKSVGTYTNGMGGALEVIAGFMGFIENPASAIVAIKDGIDSIKSAGSGGLSENTDNVIRNVYELGDNILTWSNLNININDYMRTPDPNLISKGRDENIVSPSNNTSINPNYATYGEATSDNSSALDNKYSGYVEQAKNANLAKDYNAGMEENVNEAVSDKYVKVFKVMLDKEPDYIRKVLIAIPKNHCESEW